uniref:Uncharacterized protein n=1 Tax=Nelumbo nucifera TaxID=4432 RepID=A0A822XQ27_NELNU|nr:TPA_asm: hypothetical protein HUJ06_022662 [Nelumbo nucifera]
MVSGTENRRMNKPDSKSGKLLKGRPMDRVKKIPQLEERERWGEKKQAKHWFLVLLVLLVL